MAPTPVSDEEYFVYGDAPEPFTIRSEYLDDALRVSDVGDAALYLLNPRIVMPNSEWEAWFFAAWLGGAQRYQSFENLMKAEYESFLRVKNDSTPI